MAFYPKNNDTCFCNKRPVLISEAPCAYFGSALCLFWKRSAFNKESPRTWMMSPGIVQRVGLAFILRSRCPNCYLLW